MELILLKLGYRDLKYSFITKGKHISVKIEKASPIIIKSLSITLDDTDGDILDYIYSSFITGNVFNQYKYTEFKDKVIEMLSDSGYIMASINADNRVEIDDNNNAYVYISISADEKYNVGGINFFSEEFNDVFLEKIRKCVPTPKEYHSNIISTLYTTLNQTKIFRSTDIFIDPSQIDHSNHTVPINVNLKPLARNRYAGKLGYSSNEGIITAASWQHRRNSEPGHILQTRIHASKLNYEANFSYKMPGPCPISQSFLFDLGYKRSKPNETISRTAEANASYLDKNGFFEKNYSIRIFSEKFQITDTSEKIYSKYLLPNLLLKHKYKGNSFRGYFDISTKLSFDFLFSSSNLLQIGLSNYHIYDITDNTSVHLKSNIVTTFLENNQYSTPPSLKLFSGGDSSVRGYGYNSLGPRINSASGKSIVVGGDKKLELSSEVQYKFPNNFGIAGFVDAGNAMNKWEALAWGTGIGARYTLEFGQLKLDIAKPLSKRYSKKSLRLHLSFVSSF